MGASRKRGLDARPRRERVVERGDSRELLSREKAGQLDQCQWIPARRRVQPVGDLLRDLGLATE